MANWDWYQCSVKTPTGRDVAEFAESTARALLEYFPGHGISGGRPKNGYTHGIELTDGKKAALTIWYGGNPGIHLKATGEHSPSLRLYLEHTNTPHRVSRADAADDWVSPGLFDQLAGSFLAYAEENAISIDQQGDWRRGRARTLYLGAKSSVVRLVLYEKGYESDGDPNWVRLEVRVRPQKDGKDLVATMQPGQLYGCAKWVTELLEHIGWDHIQQQTVGTVWRPSDTERARRSLVRQYGRIIEQWAEEAGSLEAMWQELKRLQQQDNNAGVIHHDDDRQRSAEPRKNLPA